MKKLKRSIKKVLILRHKDIYVVLFDQVVRFSDKKIYAGTRKLFLTHKRNGYKIIGDDYQALPKVRKDNPLVAAVRELDKTPQAAVRKKIKQKLKE